MPRRTTAPPERQPRWHAIVIGIDEYPTLLTEQQLGGCVNDAAAVLDFLVDRVKVPVENIHLLTSPVDWPADGRRRSARVKSRAASASNIRRAFDVLSAEGAVGEGDHVVLFYAGHGMVVGQPRAEGRYQNHYGLLASDVVFEGADAFTGLVLGDEIYRLMKTLEAAGATATVIADTCHAGASTRGVQRRPRTRVRFVDSMRLDERQWESLEARHPGFGGGVRRKRRHPGAASEGEATTRFGSYPGGAFVMLAGCADGETSKEDPDQQRGIMTLSLLEELKALSRDEIASLRWVDFFDRLRQSVARRARAASGETQTVQCEGRLEQRVFGGDWRPFEPGFTITRADDGVLRADGGHLHGLGEGARVAIYPPATESFVRAGDGIAARVVQAASASCIVVTDQPAAIADLSRVRLVSQATAAKPLVIRLHAGDAPLPAAMQTALDAESARGWFCVRPASDDAAADERYELRRWQGAIDPRVWPAAPERWRFARDGWVLVQLERFGVPRPVTAGEPFPAADDVVAFLPGAGEPIAALGSGADAVLGAAMARGLEAWARYVRTRDSAPVEASLQSHLSVTLHGGPASSWKGQPLASLPPLTSGGEPIVIAVNDPFCIELRLLHPTVLPLTVGAIACSDDGDVYEVWKTSVAATLTTDRVLRIGRDQQKPAALAKRGDQEAGRWLLRVIACTSLEGDPPLNLEALQQGSVQGVFASVIEAARVRTRAGMGQVSPSAPAAEQPSWFAWDFPLEVR